MGTQQKIETSKWLDLCFEDKNTSFFQTPFWYQVCSKELRSPIQSFYSISSDSLINFVSYRNPWRFRKIYESSPFGTYGGLISTAEENDQLDFLEDIFKNKNIFIRKNPFENRVYPKNMVIDNYDFTYSIFLNPVRDNLTSKWSSNHLRALNKAKTKSLSFHTSNESSAWEAHFKLYKLSSKRWGKSASNNYSKQFYNSLSKIDSKFTKIFSVYQGKEELSSGIFFEWNNRLHYWSGANHEKGLNIGASQFLFYNVLLYCQENNIQALDFNPSGGHVGVETFKKRFGALRISSDVIRFGILK